MHRIEKMKWFQNIFPACLLLIYSLVFLINFIQQSRAQSASDSIDATVKLSVCGDGTIEGQEDCEGVNLNGQSCEGLGYTSGTLSCDISCAFDTSNCISPTPTPTFTPTPTPTPTNTPTPTATTTVTPTPGPSSGSSGTSGDSGSSSSNSTIVNSVAQVVETAISTLTQSLSGAGQTVIRLPVTLNRYDFDNDGVITETEVFSAVGLWVSGWRQFLSVAITANFMNNEAENQIAISSEVIQECDINLDETCNLTDFSILMFYVDG